MNNQTLKYHANILQIYKKFLSLFKIYVVKPNMRIIIDSDIPYIGGVLEPYFDVEYRKGGDINPESVANCDALIVRTRTRCDERLLKGSKIKIIATATIGTDHIDLDYCHSAGIEVRNAKGCNARGVLQWVAAVLHHLTQQDSKRPDEYTLGVVGVGCVGSLVAHYARHWGFNILECDPPRKAQEGGDFRSIEELATKCDILTFHTPLDQTTHHLLDSRLLSIMRPDATIINASRGAVVDNSAVANSSHRYYFDVWENEPIIDTHTLLRSTLATPHIAGYSAQGKANATAMVVNEIAQYFGLPLEGWYPSTIEPSQPRLIGWEEMCNEIDKYYPISEESQQLKNNPDKFEAMRNSYLYRQEFF